jgi:hypothetical protein
VLSAGLTRHPRRFHSLTNRKLAGFVSNQFALVSAHVFDGVVDEAGKRTETRRRWLARLGGHGGHGGLWLAARLRCCRCYFCHGFGFLKPLQTGLDGDLRVGRLCVVVVGRDLNHHGATALANTDTE